MIAARNPHLYKSVSAFAPISSPSNPLSGFADEAIPRYFANKPEAAKLFDCSEVIRNAKAIPNGLIDIGTHDEYMKGLQP